MKTIFSYNLPESMSFDLEIESIKKNEKIAKNLECHNSVMNPIEVNACYNEKKNNYDFWYKIECWISNKDSNGYQKIQIAYDTRENDMFIQNYENIKISDFSDSSQTIVRWFSNDIKPKNLNEAWLICKMFERVSKNA